MKNEILERRLDLLEEVYKLDIIIRCEYDQLVELPKNIIRQELGDKDGGINKKIKQIEKLIEEMGDEYIDDETIDPVLNAQQILRKHRLLKSDLIDYILTY